MSPPVNLARRNLFRGLPTSTHAPVRPPGALPESQFVDACTACQKCVEACPEHIIVRGDGGFPEVDFSLGECTFCNLCIDKCKDSALDRQMTPPWDLKLHLAANCLALNQVICQSCSDACDQNAIRFQLQAGVVAIPDVQHESCNGCGACVGSCPTLSLSLKPMQTQAIMQGSTSHG